MLPIDDFTDRRPLGKINVRLIESKQEGILNEDGYFLFIDIAGQLSDSLNTIYISSLERYYKDIVIRISKNELLNRRVIEDNLIPSPSYPFSPNETLLRGIVTTDVDLGQGRIISTPVQGAKVKINERGIEYETDERGEYVIYFKSISEDDLDDQKKFIKMGSGTKFDLVVTGNGFQEFRHTDSEVQVLTTTVISAKLVR